MRTAVAAAAGVFLASCGLVNGVGDLVRSDDVGAADAAPDMATADTSPPLDSAIQDAGPPEDAADAACTGFCDNFDDRTTVQGAWEGIGHFGAGDPVNLSISTAEFASAPHSLRVHVPANATGMSEGLNVYGDFPLSAGKMIVDVDVKIVGSWTTQNGFVNLVEVGLVGTYAGSATTNSSGLTTDYWVNFPDGGHLQPLASTPLKDGWHHLHYEAFYDPASGSILTTWDGTTLLDVKNATTYGVPPVPATFNLTLGYTSSGDTPELNVYFDNVQVH